MKSKHRNLLLVGFSAIALLASPTHAAFILTESFESPDTADNSDPLGTPTGWTWETRNSTANQGILNYASATDGSQVFFAFSGQAFDIQTTASILNESITVGSTYTLTLDYQGYANNRIIRFGVRLLAIDGSNNVTQLATNTVNVASGHGLTGSTWNTSFSLGVTPTTNAGERLAIEFNNGGATTTAGGYIDNLKLDVVPEPSAALLGGLGFLILLRRRR
jgi:hypothetical protein